MSRTEVVRTVWNCVLGSIWCPVVECRDRAGELFPCVVWELVKVKEPYGEHITSGSDTDFDVAVSVKVNVEKVGAVQPACPEYVDVSVWMHFDGGTSRVNLFHGEWTSEQQQVWQSTYVPGCCTVCPFEWWTHSTSLDEGPEIAPGCWVDKKCKSHNGTSKRNSHTHGECGN